MVNSEKEEEDLQINCKDLELENKILKIEKQLLLLELEKMKIELRNRCPAPTTTKVRYY